LEVVDGARIALVADESDDHRVQVPEEQEEVKAELDERLLLVRVKLAEDLRCIEEVILLVDSTQDVSSRFP
jgi:hypothetical protein